MKKFLTCVLVTLMVLSLSGVVFAAEIDEGSADPSGSTSVTFQVDPTYTVTIPATVTLEKDAETGNYKQDATITATDVRLEEGKVIVVTLSGDFVLTAGKAELPYTVTVGENSTAVVDGTVVATFVTSTEAQSVTLHFAANNPTYAGNYSDTVTFTIAVPEN